MGIIALCGIGSESMVGWAMIKLLIKLIKELWDIFNYFCHLETMKHCEKYERYYPEKPEEK